MIVVTEIAERPAGAAPCERLLAITDEEVGLEAYLALDRIGVGPAFGGIRKRSYRDHEEARREVLELARGMGRKLAFAGLTAGGAKAVILDREGLEREALYEALGQALEQLGSTWVAGPDLGTRDSDLEILRRVSPMVNARANDPGRATARGVYRGMLAGLAMNQGLEDPREREVLVQGLGSVGRELAWLLLDAGARLSVADLEVARAEAFIAAENERGRGARLRSADDLSSWSGDIVAPCAVGGFIDSSRARDLQAGMICGSANDQLADQGLDQVLHDRGLLYLPDFCVNAGAVIEGVLIHQEGEAGRPTADRLIGETRDRVMKLLDRARTEACTPLAAALAVVEEAQR